MQQRAIPGRFELMRTTPPVIVDGSHNPQAAAVLAQAIREAFPDPATRPALLLGVLADKDASGIVAELAQVASAVIVTEPRSPRALPARDLAAVVRAVLGEAPPQFPSVAQALEALLDSSPNGLVITGSLTTAGEARGLLRDGS